MNEPNGTSLREHAAGLLRVNSDTYEWLVRAVQAVDPGRRPEDALAAVARAARFAADFHPGRFADGAIENVAFEVGAHLDGVGTTAPRSPARASRRRHVLHVTTQVTAVGGHTRMVAHWIHGDAASRHSLVVTDQQGEPVPGWLHDAVRSRDGELAALPPAPLLHKASWLREKAARDVDLVVLHHYAWDVVPTVAFAPPGGPPVAVLNHADHLFWLGSSVADASIDLRTAGSVHSAERRHIARNVVLPIPLPPPPPAESRADARRRLGVSDDEVVLLSVGRPEKYRPSGKHDFVATAGELLSREARSRLFVVGETAQGIAPHLHRPIHDRLHFVGRVEDPTPYRDAADVYLESFPFGSQTALLEAALAGLPVVPAYAPLFALLVANDDSVCDLLPNPASEKEFLERAQSLIREPEARRTLGARLRERVVATHVGPGWRERLEAVYGAVETLAHSPGPIPRFPCSTADADVGLSLWHVMAGEPRRGWRQAAPSARLLRHAVNVARIAGDFASARRYALRAVRTAPFESGSWRLLAAALLGTAAPTLRRLVAGWRGRPRGEGRA